MTVSYNFQSMSECEREERRKLRHQILTAAACRSG